MKNNTPQAIAYMQAGVVPEAPAGWTWQALMEQALLVAHQAISNQEVPVGALVVHSNGTVLGTGHNESVQTADPTAHAEVVALRKAGKALGNYRLEECFLVVTLEPCIMCAGACMHARLQGVVYGAADLANGALASWSEAFAHPKASHKPWHMGGVCADECAQLLHSFFEKKR